MSKKAREDEIEPDLAGRVIKARDMAGSPEGRGGPMGEDKA